MTVSALKTEIARLTAAVAGIKQNSVFLSSFYWLVVVVVGGSGGVVGEKNNKQQNKTITSVGKMN
jgi:hypothetical protein